MCASKSIARTHCRFCEQVEDEKSATNDDNAFDVQFELGEELRTHLLEAHSTEVAKSFLHPNMSDEKYAWLLSCVDYNVACTDDEPSADASPVNDDANIEDDVSGDGLSIGDNLSNLLEIINKNAVSQNPSDENPRRGIKRSIDPLMLDLLTPLNKRMFVQTGDEEMSDFKSLLKLSSLMEQEQNDSISPCSSNALVDSKAKNKVTCVVCHVDVCNTARQRHVFLHHIKKTDLYCCPKCDYTHSNSIWEARKHCTAQHGENVEPTNNERKYKDLILLWNGRCFPDWRQKRPFSSFVAEDKYFNNNSSYNSPFIDDSTSFDFPGEVDDATAICQNIILQQEDTTVREVESVEYDAFQNGQEAPVLDDKICQLCFEESRYPGRHIAKHIAQNFSRSLYECSVCDTFGSYERCTVLKHIHKVHTDHPDAQPISNLERFSEQIRQLQAQCFPNRPMKLVKMRPKENEKPRERHDCKMCGVQVAQSDRQRHVYHRHLQKERVFECPQCPFASNYDIHRVKWHIKWMHRDEQIEPITHEHEFCDEIEALNDKCFPGWQHKKRLADVDVASADGEYSNEVPLFDNSQLFDEHEGTPSDFSETMDGVDEVRTKWSRKGESGQPMHKVSEWTCRLCLKEFKPTSNFLRHVAKDHLDMPLFQCPLCDEGAPDAAEVKTHLARAHNENDMQPISNLELRADEVQEKFYECFPCRTIQNAAEKCKDLLNNTNGEDTKVTCQECFQEMKTEDRQIHVYRHHLKEPRLYECPLCDFTHHACSSDVRAHIKLVHREPDVMPRANLLQYSDQIAVWNDRCFPGWINRKLPASVMEDFNRCRMCNEDVRQTSRHIAESHLGIHLHSCPKPKCSYGAPESRLVKRHLRNHHDDDESEPIANVVVRRAEFSALHDKCFPGRPKRLANITISDEGRRTKCKQCSCTVSKKKRVAHVLEKHLFKNAYSCSICSFHHSFDEQLVQKHVTVSHPHDNAAQVISHVEEYENEIREIGLTCFPDWTFE